MIATLKAAFVGDNLSGRVLAGFGRTVDGLVYGVAQGGEFDVQRVDAGADGGGIVEPAGQVLADGVHLVARAVGVLAVFVVELGPHFRVHRGRPVEDVGGKAALGIHVARNFADRPHHLQPALRDRDPFHGLILRDGHIDGEATAHSGERDDGGGEEGTDFHGIWAICAGNGVRMCMIGGTA